MKLDISHYSAVGGRSRNEDTAASAQCADGMLFLLADGLGGHESGDLASGLACETVCAGLRAQNADPQLLAEAIVQAGRAVRSAASGTPMYTTLSALWVSNREAIAAHVGDTRIYQFRQGQIRFQTIDHSVAQTAVMVGALAPEALRKSRDRNKLFRVLGRGTDPKVDCTTLSLRRGDRFLLCTDGFWEAVTEGEMLRTMACSRTAEKWLALMRGIAEKSDAFSGDNHSAIALIIR